MGIFKLVLMDIKNHSTTFHEHMESKTQEQSGKKKKKKKKRWEKTEKKRKKEEKRRKKGGGKEGERRKKQGKNENSRHTPYTQNSRMFNTNSAGSAQKAGRAQVSSGIMFN